MLDRFNGLPMRVTVSDESPVEKAAKQLLAEREAADQPQPLIEGLSYYPELRPVVIEGVARVGDVIHIPAPSKVGKSWMAIDLALSVASGRDFLKEFETAQGPVLYLDSELHPSDLVWRFKQVAERRGVDLASAGSSILLKYYRGLKADINSIESWLRSLRKGDYRLIVIDALYRFLPPGVDENNNSHMTQVYNSIARFADHLGAVVLIVHHTSKGGQGDKRQTDVGAGASSAGRSADAYLTIRDHQKEGLFVFEGSVRTFTEPEKFTLSFSWPVWDIMRLEEPVVLTSDTKRERRQLEKDRVTWNEIFAEIGQEPFSKNRVKKILRCNNGRADRLIAFAVENELIVEAGVEDHKYSKQTFITYVKSEKSGGRK